MVGGRVVDLISLQYNHLSPQLSFSWGFAWQNEKGPYMILESDYLEVVYLHQKNYLEVLYLHQKSYLEVLFQ